MGVRKGGRAGAAGMWVAWAAAARVRAVGAEAISNNPCVIGVEAGTELGYTGCHGHDECGAAGYCDASNRCYFAEECACRGDGLGGSCPEGAPATCADACTRNAECDAWDWSYCRQVGDAGVCWAAGECTAETMYAPGDPDGCGERPPQGGVGHGALTGPRETVKQYTCMGTAATRVGSFQPAEDAGNGTYEAPVPTPDATNRLAGSSDDSMFTLLEVMLVVLFMLLMPLIMGVGIWLVYLRNRRRRLEVMDADEDFSALFWGGGGHSPAAGSAGARAGAGRDTVSVGDTADLELALLQRGIELIPQRNLFELSPEGLSAEISAHGREARRSLMFMLPGGRVVVLHRNGGGPLSFFSQNVPSARPLLSAADALVGLGCVPTSSAAKALLTPRGAAEAADDRDLESAADIAVDSRDPDLEPCCPICLDDFSEDAPDEPSLVTGCCGATFHKTCLVGWLEQASTCPNCRKDAGDGSGRGPDAVAAADGHEPSAERENDEEDDEMM